MLSPFCQRTEKLPSKNKTEIKKCQIYKNIGVVFVHNANVFVSKFQKRGNYIDSVRDLVYNIMRIFDSEEKRVKGN